MDDLLIHGDYNEDGKYDMQPKKDFVKIPSQWIDGSNQDRNHEYRSLYDKKSAPLQTSKNSPTHQDPIDEILLVIISKVISPSLLNRSLSYINKSAFLAKLYITPRTQTNIPATIITV